MGMSCTRYTVVPCSICIHMQQDLLPSTVLHQDLEYVIAAIKISLFNLSDLIIQYIKGTRKRKKLHPSPAQP